MTITRKAELYLLLITAIWGLTFPLVGAAVKTMAPMHFVAVRFSLAALLMLPFIWQNLKETNSTIIGYGILIGLINFGCYLFQGMGLQTLGSAESAFITSTAVVILPIILFIFHHDKPRFMDYLCAFICLAGLYILTGAHITGLNRGEFLTLLCAICCALSIISTEIATHKIHNIKLLVFFQIVFTAVCALPVSLIDHQSFIFNKQTIFALLYCAILATLVVFYLQAKYQKQTTAAKAALIFCAEPLFAVLYSWIIFGENASITTLVGGAVIIASIAIPDILKLFLASASANYKRKPSV